MMIQGFQMMMQGDLEEARKLVRDLQERGLRLEGDGDRLHVSPGDRLTAEEVEALKKMKCYVLETLKQNDINDKNDRMTGTTDEAPPVQKPTLLAFDCHGETCLAGDSWSWQWQGEPILYLTEQVPVGSRNPDSQHGKRSAHEDSNNIDLSALR
jgi:hypothetical protein